MNRQTGFVICLLFIPGMLHGAFQMRNLRVEPEFLKPGQEVTIYVEAVHDFSLFTNLAGVFSLNNATWDNADDYLFLYNAGEGLTALAPPVPQVYANRFMTPDQTFIGWYEYSWRTIVPATFTEGQMLTIIVRGTQQNMPMVTLMIPQDELSITVEVNSDKGVAYNTAKMSEKTATDKLIIVDAEPQAGLTASPPYPALDTVYIYTTPALDVDLWTDADSIYYTTDGSDPQNNPNATGIGSTGTVTISGDTVTLWAFAKGAAFLPAKKAWTYICELPTLQIIADPGDGTHFQIDTMITLTVLFGTDTITDATIVYTLDGSDPAENGIPYTGPFTINKSLTVKAIADKSGYISGSGAWTYIKDLISTTIWAVPDSGTTFGLSLTVSLFTNADSIHYTTNGSNPVTGGIPYTGAFIVSDNIPVVKGIAFGDNYDTVSGTWIYYRDTVPDVIADPEGQEFTSSISITLTLSEPWPGAVIYYTLDGSDPDITGSTTFKYDGTPIVITGTTTLKAQAYAGNAMPSGITIEIYTLVFGIDSAWYRDTDGDGAIDKAELVINRKTDQLPLEIEFINPFNNTDIKTVTGNAITWMNNDPATQTVIVGFTPPFPYKGLTGFTANTYGRILKGDYSKKPFTINDGVAPVIDQASYCPGRIINKTTLARANDTLLIIFSEDITALSTGVIQPFDLITEEGTEYYLDLQKLNSNQNLVTFLVEEDGINGVEFPASGDSIRIDYTFGITDLKNNNQNIENNRRVELKVKPKPVFIVINALAPFIPTMHVSGLTNLINISDAAITNLINLGGLIIIVDFLTEINNDEQGITASMEMYDPVGNLIAEGSTDNNDGNVLIGIRMDKNNLTQLIIYWAGRNLNGRGVWSGTYKGLLHITLTDLNDNNTYLQDTYNVLIGVKKK